MSMEDKLTLDGLAELIKEAIELAVQKGATQRVEDGAFHLICPAASSRNTVNTSLEIKLPCIWEGTTRLFLADSVQSCIDKAEQQIRLDMHLLSLL